MIQFSNSEIEQFKTDSRCPLIVDLLKDRISTFMNHNIKVPDSGISNWTHYFYCPDCSTKLIYDIDKPTDHECPICHKHYSDELKNGAWWNWTNIFNEQAAMDIGLLHMLTGAPVETRKAIKIFMEYAKYYPGYKEHGNIPYNSPGKLNAQALDEANFLRRMGYAYDLLEDAISLEEKESIKNNIFKEGISFLKGKRKNQLHNHEVIIDGTIAILALILKDEEALDFALYGKYGFVYQLEHATLEDDFWFECSTAYHLYALQNMLQYEKFARLTPYSFLNHPKYRGMIDSIIRLQKSDMSFPLLNDSKLGQGNKKDIDMFEFAYKTWKDPQILRILNNHYRTEERLSLESFFYGEKELPEASISVKAKSIAGEYGLGLSVIRRGKDYLLFRHGPYGGEHDHYDRLAISYEYDNTPVSIDIGTTGYGAPLHYNYYKNSHTHNTITINGNNQAPSCGKLLEFKETEDMVIAKAEVHWVPDYKMPDSFTIKQWDEESYRDVYAKRTIVCTEYGILDYLEVENASTEAIIDLNMHFHGSLVSEPSCKVAEDWIKKGPYEYFHDVKELDPSKLGLSVFENHGIRTYYFYDQNGHKSYSSLSYDNPSSNEMNYLTFRTRGSKASYRSFISSGRTEKISSVSFNDNSFSLILDSGRTISYNF